MYKVPFRNIRNLLVTKKLVLAVWKVITGSHFMLCYGNLINMCTMFTLEGNVPYWENALAQIDFTNT